MSAFRFLQHSCLLVCFVVALFVVPVSAAFAADRVVLKDGTTVEGKIVREDGGLIWIEVVVSGIKQQRMLLPSEIGSVERDAGSETKNAPDTKLADEAITTPAAPAAADAASNSRRPPRAMVITMGDKTKNNDMVGVYMTAHSVQQAIPLIEKEIGNDGTGVLVLRINSGGGALIEISKLSDMIQNELKPKFRVVGWIEFATSAAAMTAHAIEEIYFTSRGEYGSCTGFSGNQFNPMEGFGLEKVIHYMEEVSKRGNHNYLIMRAMQIQQPLSATVNSDGTVSWFPDASSGDIVVNRDKEVLSFNSLEAAQVKFSKGTADSLEELTKAMGYQELEWVGEKMEGIAWPVSKAEKAQMEFRDKTRLGENAMQSIFAKYQRSVAAAAAEQDRTTRAGYVGTAKRELEKLEAIVRNNPRVALMNWGSTEAYEELIREQKQILRDLMR